MPKPIKVFNKGIRPIVFRRTRNGIEVIHPGKFLTFNQKIGEAIIQKHENACSEDDYKKHLVEMVESLSGEKLETEPKKKSKTTGSK